MATKKKPRTVTRSYSLTEAEVTDAVRQFLGLQEAARVQVRLKPRQGGLLERVNVTKIPWLSVELEVTAESAE